jgi:hypothetical protein
LSRRDLSEFDGASRNDRPERAPNPLDSRSLLMLTLLAHVTPTETPYGVLLFAAGWAAGLVSAVIYFRYVRTR